jgi:hypothetical protein
LVLWTSIIFPKKLVQVGGVWLLWKHMRKEKVVEFAIWCLKKQRSNQPGLALLVRTTCTSPARPIASLATTSPHPIFFPLPLLPPMFFFPSGAHRPTPPIIPYVMGSSYVMAQWSTWWTPPKLEMNPLFKFINATNDVVCYYRSVRWYGIATKFNNGNTLKIKIKLVASIYVT